MTSTLFIWSRKFTRQRQSSLQGAYEGIGAIVDTTGDYLTIVSPIQGSPADKAGIKAGDKVIAIDGQDMTGVAAEQARLKVSVQRERKSC